MSFPELPDLVFPSTKSTKSGRQFTSESNKRKKLEESSFDPSDSLFSTLDGESSYVFRLNPLPTKKFRMEDTNSTSEGESSYVFKLNPLPKRKPIPEVDISITSSSSSSSSNTSNSPYFQDQVVGLMHPNDENNVSMLEDEEMVPPGSPLDRSTPISDYEMEEAEPTEKSSSPKPGTSYSPHVASNQPSSPEEPNYFK